MKFAVYTHPHTCYTSKPMEEIAWVGHSMPYFSAVRERLAEGLKDYPQLPLRQADLDLFLTVHTQDYLSKIQRMAADEPLEEIPRMSMECRGFEYCLPAYQYGLGGLIEAIDQMKAGKLDRAYCFSLGGHHAYPDWGHGYCLLNPEAAAVRYAQLQGFEKVLVVDWDLHHGDGTQSIFANDSSVYCISIHSAIDLYMTIMGVMRQGTSIAGKAVGHCNIPVLDKEYGNLLANSLKIEGNIYQSYEAIFALQHELNHLPFDPDLIVIFSGYDSHGQDSGRYVTDFANDDFRTITRAVLNLSSKIGCPVLSVHGGGYVLDVTVSAALAHVETLAT